jgi:hypothetical protein
MTTKRDSKCQIIGYRKSSGDSNESSQPIADSFLYRGRNKDSPRNEISASTIKDLQWNSSEGGVG